MLDAVAVHALLSMHTDRSRRAVPIVPLRPPHPHRRGDVRFESAERRIDRVESEAEAIGMGRGKGLADQIAGVEGNERIEAELADLKSRVGQGKSAAGKESE